MAEFGVQRWKQLRGLRVFRGLGVREIGSREDCDLENDPGLEAETTEEDTGSEERNIFIRLAEWRVLVT